jgi:hypothetical protein
VIGPFVAALMAVCKPLHDVAEAGDGSGAVTLTAILSTIFRFDQIHFASVSIALSWLGDALVPRQGDGVRGDREIEIGDRGARVVHPDLSAARRYAGY